MINLLIVDDEILTREGIVDGMPWKELGIDRVLQADDGSKGVDLVAEFKPNIVLTDVRMPFMDGIEMSKQIRKVYPDCKIIFMSGYSDKEYLMSAIQLRAVSYIEKPIRRDELKKVLEEAVKACNDEENTRLSKITTHRKLNISIPFVKNEIAIRLLYTSKDSDLIRDLLDLELVDVNPDAEFITVIVKTLHATTLNDSDFSMFCEGFINEFSQLLANYELKGISAFKDRNHFIAHVCCSKRNTNSILENNLKRLCQELNNILLNKNFFVCLGKQVTGIHRILESYNSAVLSLQKSFFRGYNAIVLSREDKSLPYVFDEEKLVHFSRLLTEVNSYEAQLMIHSLSSEIKKHENTIINYIKDIYYRFMLTIIKHAEKYGITIFIQKMDKDYLWETFSAFHTLDEIMTFLLIRISDYFKTVEKMKNERNGILNIINFIQKNYMNENLSVKDISSYTYLSPAYMCTYFKHETGKTINRYVTECRIEKAKELLYNKEYSVSEVAGKVGYNDGNYFTKLFKKSMGVTPSEYRERLTK